MFLRDRVCFRDMACFIEMGHVLERQGIFWRDGACFGELGHVSERAGMFWRDGVCFGETWHVSVRQGMFWEMGHDFKRQGIFWRNWASFRETVHVMDRWGKFHISSPWAYQIPLYRVFFIEGQIRISYEMLKISLFHVGSGLRPELTMGHLISDQFKSPIYVINIRIILRKLQL